MKKINLFFCVLLGLCLCLPISNSFKVKNEPAFGLWQDAASPFSLGNGTAENPFIISGPGHLAFLSNEVNGANFEKYINASYKLTANINMGAHNFRPIACESRGFSFSGVLDGNGFTISNLTITEPYGEGLGLFSNLWGEVKNLVLRNCNYSSQTQAHASGLVACALERGTIRNVKIYASRIISNSINVGGFVGRIIGEETAKEAIKDCVVSNCEVKNLSASEGKTGGLVGSISHNVLIDNVIFEGKVFSSSPYYTGGAIGLIGAGVSSITNVLINLKDISDNGALLIYSLNDTLSNSLLVVSQKNLKLTMWGSGGIGHWNHNSTNLEGLNEDNWAISGPHINGGHPYLKRFFWEGNVN